MSPFYFRIEARAYDIAGIASHNFWVLLDAQERVLGQLHGLATDRQCRILPIGRYGDKLKFYHFGPRATLFGLTLENDRNFIKSNQMYHTAVCETAEKILQRWDHAVTSLPLLNSLDLDYTPFGILGLPAINSNSAYTILGKLMGLTVPVFSRYWQPGWKNDNQILSPERLDEIGFASVDRNDNFA